jgi:histidine ammonia-lyase
MTNHRQNRYQQPLDAKSIAGILLREHDNVEQAIRYAKRMAQRYADSRSLMAMEYLDAAQELEAWAKNKPR